MRVAIAAGGTGGHIYPGIAIAQEIKRRDPGAEILFLGSEDGLEKDLVPRAGFAVKLIRVRRGFPSPVGFFQALSVLRSFSPQALLSTGGYASLPAVIAARLSSIPVYIHEQNVLPGLVNRVCGRLAKKVFLSFDGSQRYLRGVVTGNPVRREIMEADRESARRNLGFSAGDTVVLVMGGSQGARRINEAVASALPMIQESQKSKVKSQNFKIFHVVGHRDARLMAEEKYDFYQRVDYMYNMGEALAAADIAVSRAGATAISEFLVRGLPMVLIPFPFAAGGHQEFNARAAVESGAAVVVSNDDFTPEKFVSLIMDKELDLERMKENCLKLARPEAAKEIACALA